METWLPVVGFEGRYWVSDLGRVRSERKVLVIRCSGKYPDVFVGNGIARKAVHRLVARAFLGPRPPGLVVCHADGDRMNAKLQNLRYDTPASNEADKLAHGRRVRGARCTGSKLTEESVLAIRADARPNSVVAAEYGVTKQAIRKVRSGESWAWVEGGR